MYIPRDELIASAETAWVEYLLMQSIFGKTHPITINHGASFRRAYELCRIAHIDLEDLNLPEDLPPMPDECYNDNYDPLEGGLSRDIFRAQREASHAVNASW